MTLTILYFAAVRDLVGKDEEKIELKVGESYQMKIIKLAPEERKIGLSMINVEQPPVEEAMANVKPDAPKPAVAEDTAAS